MTRINGVAFGSEVTLKKPKPRYSKKPLPPVCPTFEEVQAAKAAHGEIGLMCSVCKVIFSNVWSPRVMRSFLNGHGQHRVFIRIPRRRDMGRAFKSRLRAQR